MSKKPVLFYTLRELATTGAHKGRVRFQNGYQLNVKARPPHKGVTPLSIQTIYDHMNAGLFPRPVKIGPKKVVWPAEVIHEWLLKHGLSIPDTSAEA